MSMSVRMNYTMTPNLTLEVYAQPFTANGVYSDFREVVRRRRRRVRRALRP